MAIFPALIEAVADAEDTEPAELDLALEEHISTDALRQLDEHENELWTLQFELPNHAVMVSGDGTILVDGS
jgi:hypothetical protein